jgi:hypothetical protein
MHGSLTRPNANKASGLNPTLRAAAAAMILSRSPVETKGLGCWLVGDEVVDGGLQVDDALVDAAL